MSNCRLATYSSNHSLNISMHRYMNSHKDVMLACPMRSFTVVSGLSERVFAYLLLMSSVFEHASRA